MATLSRGGKRHRGPDIEIAEIASTGTTQSKESKVTRRRFRSGNDHFACPFCKHDRRRWGTFDTCGGWHNDNLGTLFRHHLLKTHKDANDGFALDDPRRIDPQVFMNLQSWRDSLRLEKKRGAELWTTAYMILFNIDDSAKSCVPSPYFTNELANCDTDQIDPRAFNDTEFVEYDNPLMLAQMYQIKLQREIERGYVSEYFGRQIQGLEDQRDAELLRVDERLAEALQKLHATFKLQLKIPAQLTSDEDLTYLGTAPSQSIDMNKASISTTSLAQDALDTLSPRFTQSGSAGYRQTPSSRLNRTMDSGARHGRRNDYFGEQGPVSASRLAGNFLIADAYDHEYMCRNGNELEGDGKDDALWSFDEYTRTAEDA